MRFLAAAIIGLFLFSSCYQPHKEEKGKELKGENLTKEEVLIKALLSPLKIRGVDIKEIKPAKDIKVPGFKAYEVTLVDTPNAREVKRYVFISKDNKFLTLDIFMVEERNGQVHIQPIRPKEPEKPIKVDLSWLKDVEKRLDEERVPHVIGKSDKKVYIVWDVLCPFCYSHFNKIDEVAKESGVELHMIPLAIHGEDSVKGLIYFTDLARRKGIVEAFKELYRLGDGNFKVYVEKLRESEKGLKLQDKEREKLKRFFLSLKEELLKRGVHATPSIIYIPPGEKDKGYIIVGFKPINEVIKMK